MNKGIKTFNDLEFINRPEFNMYPGTTKSASMDLGNEVMISVIDGASHYSNPGETYEVAVYHQGAMVQLNEYDQVLGWQDAREVELLMKDIQMNPQWAVEQKEKYTQLFE